MPGETRTISTDPREGTNSQGADNRENAEPQLGSHRWQSSATASNAASTINDSARSRGVCMQWTNRRQRDSFAAARSKRTRATSAAACRTAASRNAWSNVGS